MKKLLIAATMALACSAALAQTSYNRVGKTIYGSDGSTHQQVGGTTYHNYSDGSSSTSQRVGRSTYHSDGTSTQHIGNTSYDSDGTSRQRIGNFTYGSDGTSCQRIGNQMYCN